jgi:hypothetical protein
MIDEQILTFSLYQVKGMDGAEPVYMVVAWWYDQAEEVAAMYEVSRPLPLHKAHGQHLRWVAWLERLSRYWPRSPTLDDLRKELAQRKALLATSLAVASSTGASDE